MNEAVYQMAAMGGSVRIVVQKKPDGNFILGVSNGKDNPLICQGMPEAINTDFAARLPGYLEKIRNAAIEAKLNAAVESQQGQETVAKPKMTETPNTPVSSAETNENDQPELDFGF
ncbi:MAG: hypothetical protein WC082_12370 [Victivallales bacterium]